jgi:peroxiredoxin
MKKLVLAGFAIAMTGLVAFAPLNVLPIGAEMPRAEVKMKDIQGKEISLKEARKANGLLVMFTCNTCPYVIKNQERTREIASYAVKNEVGVILINSNEAQRDGDDSPRAMQAYAKDQAYKWNYVIDEGSTMADAFGATRTPETFLFNKEGKLVYHGAIDNNPGDASSVSRKHLQIAIDEMKSGKDVAVKETRSVGCGIKRKG